MLPLSNQAGVGIHPEIQLEGLDTIRYPLNLKDSFCIPSSFPSPGRIGFGSLRHKASLIRNELFEGPEILGLTHSAGWREWYLE